MTNHATTRAEPFDINVEVLNRGTTLKALARDLGVHQHVVRAIAGKLDRAVTAENAKVVADYFDLRVTDLIDARTRKSLLLSEDEA